MAAQNPPSFMQNVATETAAQARNALAGIVTTAGVVLSGDLSVSQHSTPNMSVDIAAGAVWIKGTENSLQGYYHCFNDALANVVVAASDPTNPRIDRVVAKVQDAFYSGATNAWSMAIVTGTPTAGATLVNLNGVGAAPNNAVTLAYILVPATSSTVTNANISDQRPRANPLGGIQTTSTAFIATNEATSSATYVDLATAGPSVTVTTGTSAIISLGAQIIPSATGTVGYVSASVSGATTIAASDNDAFLYQAYTASGNGKGVWTYLLTGLNAGVNTFKLQYKTTGTANFASRRITVTPLT